MEIYYSSMSSDKNRSSSSSSRKLGRHTTRHIRRVDEVFPVQVTKSDDNINGEHQSESSSIKLKSLENSCHDPKLLLPSKHARHDECAAKKGVVKSPQQYNKSNDFNFNQQHRTLSEINNTETVKMQEPQSICADGLIDDADGLIDDADNRVLHEVLRTPLDDELLTVKLKQLAIDQKSGMISTHTRFAELVESDDGDVPISSLLTAEDSNFGRIYYVNDKSPLNSQHLKKDSGYIGKDDSHADVVYKDTFAGHRLGFLNPRVAKNLEAEIRSPKGTVRGYKNRVAAGIATFHFVADQNSGKVQEVNYGAIEEGKIVFYSTSLSIVREVFRDCQVIRNILHTHMVLYEERDLCMNNELQTELSSRLEGQLILPAVFVDGHFLAGAEKLQVLNETGELRQLFCNYLCVSIRSACERCGGYRYVPCTICRGSKKSLHRNHFTETFHALRCTVCNENGLVQCVVCHNQPR